MKGAENHECLMHFKRDLRPGLFYLIHLHRFEYLLTEAGENC